MKQITILLMTFLLTGVIEAQNYKNVKNMLAINQFGKAKEEYDKASTNEKFFSKPEGYIAKASIFAGLSMAEENKGKPEGDQLAKEGDQAFQKYKEMDASMELLSDQVYGNAPINLYSNFYTSGYYDYTSKKWEAGFNKLKKAVEYSDLLIGRNILNTKLDTNVLILAAITSQQSGHNDDAYIYYGRLANEKIGGEGFEDVYRFMVNQSFQKKDMAAFDKYKAMGKELYPNSEYFDFDKVDFAIGLTDNLGDKIKELESVLATNPNNYRANEVLGRLIYDTLNPRDEEKDPVPSNFDELEKKMITAFNKASQIDPKNEMPYLMLGYHYYNQAVKVADERSEFAKTIGAKPTADDVKKRGELDQKYADAMETARAPYEKVVELYQAHTEELKPLEKQQYKRAVSDLATIASVKKRLAKAAADKKKYEDEEKKWNDLWDSLH